MSRVPGHALVAEGAPHDTNGQRIGVAGTGRALCECGTTSAELPSSTARHQWHRNHKAEIESDRQAFRSDVETAATARLTAAGWTAQP